MAEYLNLKLDEIELNSIVKDFDSFSIGSGSGSGWMSFSSFSLPSGFIEYIELIMAIDEEFDIKIPDDRADKFETVGDILNYVAEKVL